jgi:hypothetical protein
MAVMLPRAPAGLMPEPYGVAAEHNWLFANVDFGDFFDPHELVLKLSDHAVTISQYEADPLAPNPLPYASATLGPTVQKSPGK